MRASPRTQPPWQRYRPCTTGDLLDRSLVLLRRRFVHIFAISLVLQLVEYLTGAWTGQGATLSSQLSNLGQSFTDFSTGATLWGPLVLVVNVLVGQLTLAAATLFVAADVDGRDGDYGGVARDLIDRMPALLWTLALLGMLLAGALMIGGVALAGVAGLATGLGPLASTAVLSSLAMAGLLLATVVMLRVAVTPVVVMVEGSRGLAAVARSWRLVSRPSDPGLLGNSRVRIALIYTVIMCTGWGVAALASLPAVGLQFIGALGGEGAAVAGAVPLLLRVLLELIEVAGQAAIGPFGALALAYFYFDLRARHEGLDLLLSARHIADQRGVELT